MVRSRWQMKLGALLSIRPSFCLDMRYDRGVSYPPSDLAWVYVHLVNSRSCTGFTTFVYKIINCSKICVENEIQLVRRQRVFMSVVLHSCWSLPSECNSIHLLNLITILQWYTEINRKQMRYLAQTLKIWHAWRKTDIFTQKYKYEVGGVRSGSTFYKFS